jgi:tRNA(fMet)-specific endonuclease VapC
VIRHLLDTDTFTFYLRQHPSVCDAVPRHRPDGVGVTIITAEEIWDGWQAAIRTAKTPDQIGAAYDRLTKTLDELRNWPIVSYPPAAVERYASLKKQKLNVGANDLKIAAIGLVTAAVVVTHNTRDFSRVPGLTIEDWVT